MALSFEKKSLEELQAMAAYDQGVALNELIAETLLVGRNLTDATNRIFDARIVLNESNDASERKTARSNKLLAEKDLTNAKHRAAILKTVASGFQSLLKVTQL